MTPTKTAEQIFIADLRNVGNISIRIDGNNISLIQPDPITGIKNWVVVTKEELKQIINLTND